MDDITNRSLPEGPVERICRWTCRFCLVGMVGIIALELVLRGVFHHSLEFADEIAAYLLVAFTYISLSVSLAADGFHRVEFLLGRLGPRGRLLAFLTFNMLSLLFAVVLVGYGVRLVLNSYQQDARVMSVLFTPLWIPQIAVPLGLAALCFTLVRVILRDIQSLRSVR
jgi:TRAP-type C4-dicarboxylate transport system permease small subunit